MRALEAQSELPPRLSLEVAIEVLVQRGLIVLRDHTVVRLQHCRASVPRHEVHVLGEYVVVLEAVALSLDACANSNAVVLKVNTSSLAPIHTNTVNRSPSGDSCIP